MIPLGIWGARRGKGTEGRARTAPSGGFDLVFGPDQRLTKSGFSFGPLVGSLDSR